MKLFSQEIVPKVFLLNDWHERLSIKKQIKELKNTLQIIQKFDISCLHEPSRRNYAYMRIKIERFVTRNEWSSPCRNNVRWAKRLFTDDQSISTPSLTWVEFQEIEKEIIEQAKKKTVNQQYVDVMMVNQQALNVTYTIAHTHIFIFNIQVLDKGKHL